MFVTAGMQVDALDAKTGERIWSWRSDTVNTLNVDLARSGLEWLPTLSTNHGLPAPAGVAVGEGLVFVGLSNGNVVALNQKTGQPAWMQQTGETVRRGQAVTTPPTYARGLVLTGLANGDLGIRGRIVALNAKTGKVAWNLSTVPGPNELGYDTWTSKDRELWRVGGVGVWWQGAVDAELGLVYYVTGNPMPAYGGELRGGDNLFSATALALDLKTGKRRWHFQAVRHDIWEADLRVSPVLYDVEMGGRLRKAVAILRGDGYLFSLDRETGKAVFPIEDQPVPQEPRQKTAATQPFPVGGESLVPSCDWWRGKVPAPFVLDKGHCQFAPIYFDRHNVVAPGFSVSGMMSFDPQSGYFYAQGTASLSRRRRNSEDPWLQELASSDSLSLFDIPKVSVLAAIDSRTNKIVWKHETIGSPATANQVSGLLTTAGRLLFRGAEDGNVEAFDVQTGDRVWQFQTGIRWGRSPMSTYEVDGEQYLAVAMRSAVWTFKLGGNQQQQPAPPAPEVPQARGEETVEIETSSVVNTLTRQSVGRRFAVDEHAFNPLRSRVKAGTQVRFLNSGRIVHTIAAEDGAWTIGPLNPAHDGFVTFDKPGTYRYSCKEHPWAIGQVMVVP